MSRHPLERVQATLVARRYFIERQTKIQIAESLSLSRFKVARLIEAAIADGLVRFVISEPDDIDVELSETMRQRFGLKSVLVLRGPDLPASALTGPLGAMAAMLLGEMLRDGQVLGVAWGRTLAATARALVSLPRVDVVQASGSMSRLDHAHSPVGLVHQFASISGGVPYSMYVPMWVEDAALVGSLRGELEVAKVFEQYERIDVLISGIGSWEPPQSFIHDSLPERWRAEARGDGVCADLCATFIDRNGEAVPGPLDRNGIALGTTQLRRIPDVIGVGGGVEKTQAIGAVLKGRWIHHLVTDASVARRLLAHET